MGRDILSPTRAQCPSVGGSQGREVGRDGWVGGGIPSQKQGKGGGCIEGLWMGNWEMG